MAPVAERELPAANWCGCKVEAKKCCSTAGEWASSGMNGGAGCHDAIGKGVLCDVRGDAAHPVCGCYINPAYGCYTTSESMLCNRYRNAVW